MYFNVPKVVRCPGCDHGHEEESRNGRDVKIDILEAYVWILEVFQVKSGFYGVPGGYRNPPGNIWALMGFSGKEKGAAQGGCAPPSFRPLSSIPVWPNKAHILPSEFS